MTDTRVAILRAALSAAQAHGYDGLVFRDLATRVGVTSATVHHHFATKSDLGVAIARRQWQDARMRLDALSVGYPDPAERLDAYPELFQTHPCDEARMCLHGVMVAQHRDLPDAVRSEVELIAEVHLGWLVGSLLEARPDVGRVAATRRARSIFAALTGAQLVARAHVEASFFDEVIQGYRDSGLFRV